MKRLIYLGFALLFSLAFLGQNAKAADLPVKAPQPVVNPADLFTGWWVGGEAGYGTGTINPDLTVVGNLGPNGFVGGGLLGYRSRVTNNIYLGLFTNLDFADLGRTISPAKGVSVNGKTNMLGTTTVQVGYLVMPQLLVYGDAGIAVGRTKASAAAGGLSLADTENAFGWTIGAGADYALSQFGWNGWTAGVSYSYIDLGKSSACFGIGAGGACIGTHYSNTENVILANLKYRFGM